MIALSLDTSTRAGSVALVDEDRIVLERAGDASRSHAERLPGELVSLLDEAEVPVSAVDLFAVAVGPGSFTGLRIGIATIQGLAFVNERRIVGVSTLEALAHAQSGELLAGTLVAPWIDAQRREIYSALYEVTGAPRFDARRLVEREAPAVAGAAETLDRWALGVPATFVGDGAILYTDTIRRADARHRVVAPPLVAGTIGRVAIARARLGEATGAAGVHPLYVRRPDAVLDREKHTR